MIFEEKLISSEKIYDGAILNLRRDKVTAVKGEAYREIIEHNGAVCMVPVTSDGKVVLVEQFRYAMGQVVLEVPAGKIDKGETDPVKTAVRELKEETGFSAGDVRFLGMINTSVAYSQEKIYVYGMAELTRGETNFDDDEAIDMKLIDFDEAYHMAVTGQLIDVKTIAALAMAKEQMKDILKKRSKNGQYRVQRKVHKLSEE